MTTLSQVGFSYQMQSHARRNPPSNPPHQHDQHINISSPERIGMGISGGALALWALSRRTPGSMLMGLLGGGLLYMASTGHCPVYESLAIDTRRSSPPTPHDYFHDGIHVEVTQTIAKSADELYRFWRDFSQLPRFMHHLKSVKVLDDRRSFWEARGPAGSTVDWYAEIINDEPGKLIAWRSLAESDVDSAGSVRFVPASGDRGTEVHVVMDYIPPAGRIGQGIAKMFGEDPKQQITQDLRRFKRLMETGEVATTQGQSQGACVG
jgi:uncharacterized membrane protein